MSTTGMSYYTDKAGCRCACSCKEVRSPAAGSPCHNPRPAIGGLKEHPKSDCQCADPQHSCPQYDNYKSHSEDWGAEYPSDAGPMYKKKSGAMTSVGTTGVAFMAAMLMAA